MRSTLRRGAVVAFGAVAALSLGLGSAIADPNLANDGTAQPGGFLPDADDIVGSGSDTIQYVTNELSRGYVDGGFRLASFNAFQPGTEAAPVTGDPIQVRPGVPTIARPNGSSAGIRALWDPATADLVDFARSSRLSNGSSQEDTLAFIPFARDGVGYIVDDGSFVPDNLTAANLRDIYTCQLPGYEAKLPQNGSGTRTFFLGEINVTEAEAEQAVVDGCVEEVQEHDDSVVDGNSFALAPFSTARYSFDPVNGNPPANRVVLADGVGVFSESRLVLHVVKESEWTGSAGARQELVNVFGPSGLVCDALADGEYQGFTAIEAAGPDCGVALPDA